MFDVPQTQQKYKQVKTQLFFVMFSIFKTSFKEKNVSLIRAVLVSDMWVNVIAILLVYWRDVRSENKMSCLKARIYWQSMD